MKEKISGGLFFLVAPIYTTKGYSVVDELDISGLSFKYEKIYSREHFS